MRVLLFLGLLPWFIFGTEIQVVDASNGEPLAGVNITIVGTTDGLNTNMDGFFELSSRHRNHQLKFSYIGYLDTTIDYAVLSSMTRVELAPAILDLSGIEVISSKLEWEQTDMPAIVNVIRTREMVHEGATEIKEVLQRDPSVIIDDGFDGEQQISIRGSNANEVMIIYDGIPMNSSYQGRFDLSWLNLNDVESLSIIKGGGTLRYTSGAFGGVVVIDPPQTGNTSLQVNMQRDDQNLNSFSVSNTLAWRKLQTRFSYSGREFMPNGLGSNIISDRRFLNLYTGYALRDTANIVSIGHVDIQESRAASTDYQDDYRDTYTQLRYKGSLGVIPNLYLQLLNRDNTSHFLNRTATDYHHFNDAGESSQMLVLENRYVRSSLINFMRFELKQDLHSSTSRVDNLQWEHRDIHEIDLDQVRYAVAEVIKFRLSMGLPLVDFMELNGSIRYDNVALEKKHQATRDGEIFIDDQSSESNDYFSRRNGFTLNKTRKRLKYQLFYGSGTSIRYPSMNDLYLRENTTIVAYQSEGLYPELNSSLEVGFQMTVQAQSHSRLIQSMDIQAARFRNQYIDKIYYRSIPRALPTPINFSATTNLTGFEISTMISMLSDHVRLVLGTTRLNISSYTIFPNKPEFKDVAEVEFRAKHGRFRVHYFHEGKQYYAGSLDGINYVVRGLSGRENVHLYASTNIPIFKQEFIVGASLQNFLTAEDASLYFDQRRWVINVGLNF
jgi:hypothetical protein